MDLYEISDQVVALLRKRGRIAYQSLKYQFRLDDEGLAALKEELLYSYAEIADDAGRGLMWVGEQAVADSQHSVVSSPPIPTPQSLTPHPQHPTPST